MPRGNAAVQKDAVRFGVGLLAADHKLPVLNRDGDVISRESGHGQRDDIAVPLNQFDVEGRIPFGPGPGGPFDKPFQRFKAQHQRMRRKDEFGHIWPHISDTLPGPAHAATGIKAGYGKATAPLQGQQGDCTPRKPCKHQIRQMAKSSGKTLLFQPACGSVGQIFLPSHNAMNAPMELSHEEVLRVRLEVLRREHRDLDDAISAMQERAVADQLTLVRLKKRKLVLKDQIARIADELTPDIIA